MLCIGCDDCCVVVGGFEFVGGVIMDFGGVFLQLYSKSVSVISIVGFLIVNFLFWE